MEDILIDNEGNFVQAADGDTQTVLDYRCLIQDIKHRLLTYVGDLWLHQEYGCRIRDFIQADNSEINRLELEQMIRLTIRDEELIDPESVRVSVKSWNREGITISAGFWPVEDFEDINTGAAPRDAAIIITIDQTGIGIGGI